MFTQCWGILQTPIPSGISVFQSIALVNAIAKLHKFCIDNEDKAHALIPGDYHSLVTNPNGYVPLKENAFCDLLLPTQIMRGGHHFNGVDKGFCRGQALRDLPQQRLHNEAVNWHLIRPRSCSAHISR